MRRTLGLALLALAASAAPAQAVVQNDPIVAPPTCTAREFKAAAIESYLPWHERRTGKAELKALKACAQNDKTRRQMIRIEREVAQARVKVIRNYHRWTPYVEGSYRGATPSFVAYCESGQNFNASGGYYGFLDSTWAYYSNLPGPAGANHLEQHRVAHKIEVSVGASAWECWSGRPATPFEAPPLTLSGFTWRHGQ